MIIMMAREPVMLNGGVFGPLLSPVAFANAAVCFVDVGIRNKRDNWLGKLLNVFCGVAGKCIRRYLFLTT